MSDVVTLCLIRVAQYTVKIKALERIWAFFVNLSDCFKREDIKKLNAIN